MTFSDYQALSPLAQLYYALHQGLFLARRLAGTTHFHLYYCADEAAGWLVELSYDREADVLTVCRSADTRELLADYAADVRLPQR